MNSVEALKTFFAILAVIVAVPILIVTVKIGFFVGSLSKSVTSLEAAATLFTNKVDKNLEQLSDASANHEVRLRLIEEPGWRGIRRRVTDVTPPPNDLDDVDI